MSPYELATAAAELRRIAGQLATVAPSVSVRTAALATDLELRVRQQSALR